MKAPFQLLWKLLAINGFAIVIAVLTIAIAIHLLAAKYLMTLSQEYSVEPHVAHAMFVRAVDRYLLLASVTGFCTAIFASLWLNYRLTRPIWFIKEAAARISIGEYDQRVNVEGCGEIDQLSGAFNLMAECLQKSKKLRNEFVIDVAHELRTPLTNIRGYTEGLRDGVIPGEASVFESLHEESLRLVHLVEDLLQLARADVARQDLVPESFDLAPLIEQVALSFQLRMRKRSLTVALDVPSFLRVTADRKRLSQVLTNIFENALRYSSTGGCVKVAAVQDQATLRVVVSNDVEGTPTLSDSLFERFHRGDVSRSRESGGAGLGLAIVRQLIEAHGGRTGIQSVGGRAEVWFELPSAR